MAEIFDFGMQQHKIKMDGKFFENNLFAVAGDTGRRLEVQLLDSNNMAQNTTGISLRLNANVAGQATYAEATLVDATKGLYELDLPNGMLIAPGNWQFQWQITDSAGKKLHSFAFTGSVGSNLSEGGSEATNFYLNVDDLKQMQEDLINGTFDSVALETNIAGKLTDLETQYAPKLTEVTAQLAENGEEIEAGRYVDSQHIASLAHILNDTKSTDFTDPLIQVTNTTNDEKKHVAFPAAAIDGNNVLVMYRRGATHISTGGTQDNGSFVQKKSVDGGTTWSAETIVYPSTVGFDARDPNIYQLSATELILVFPLVGLNTDGTIKSVENEVWKTIDFGASWSKIGVLPKKENGNYYHIVRGSITKSTTGRILIPVWSANLSTSVTTVPYIVYSGDNGLTWNVGKDISNAQATETAIEFDNHNRLWAVMRNDLTTGIQRTRNMLIAFSDDSGETWSNAVEMPIKGHAPHLLKLSKGLFLTYRNTDKYIVNSTQDRYSTNFAVLNNGAITSTINSVFDSQSPDQAYPWAVKNGSKIFLFFYVYSHPTVGFIYLKTLDIAKVERLSLTQKADITYINVGNTKTSIIRHKTFIGDNSVQGNGTTLASKIIGLGETVKGIKNVKVTVLNDTNVNFITTVSGVTTTGFTVNVKNITGVFSTAVQIYWEVIAELN